MSTVVQVTKTNLSSHHQTIQMFCSKSWTHALFKAYLLYSIIVHCVCGQYSSNGVDAAWEFIDGLEGWGQATSNEMQADVYQMGDEMWIDKNGPDESYIDSPFMKITRIEKEQTVAIRYRYVGKSRYGKLRLYGKALGNSTTALDQSKVKDFIDFHFPIIGDSHWHIGYIPFQSEGYIGKEPFPIQSIYQMRLWPGIHRNSSKKWEQSHAPQSGDAFQIDWIRLVRSPIVDRITGCNGLKLSKDNKFNDIHYDIDEPIVTKINGILTHHRTIWKTGSIEFPYASTYNCLRKGGENITIEGKNFGLEKIQHGKAAAHVFIDGTPCLFVSHDRNAPQERLTCITPGISPEHFMDFQYGSRPSKIEVKNGMLPGLVGTTEKFAYASHPQKPEKVWLSNVASRLVQTSVLYSINH